MKKKILIAAFILCLWPGSYAPGFASETPRQEPSPMDQARFFFKNKDYWSAALSARKALGKDPSDKAAYETLYLSQLQLQDYREAMRTVRLATKYGANTLPMHLFYCELSSSSGDYYETLTELASIEKLLQETLKEKSAP